MGTGCKGGGCPKGTAPPGRAPHPVARSHGNLGDAGCHGNAILLLGRVRDSGAAPAELCPWAPGTAAAPGKLLPPPVTARPPVTFEAADPPEPRMRKVAPRFPRRSLRFVRRDVGAVADVRAGVQPVVGTDGDGHEAESGESSHRGQQHLDATVTPHHGAS